jgi:hypothetical protein
MNKRREKEFPRKFSNFHLIILCFIGLTDWSHLYVCYGNQNKCQRGKRKLEDGLDLHSRDESNVPSHEIADRRESLARRFIELLVI